MRFHKLQVMLLLRLQVAKRYSRSCGRICWKADFNLVLISIVNTLSHIFEGIK